MRMLFSFLLSVTVFSSCRMFGGKRISGNGNITTQSVSVSNFEAVDATGAVTVQVRQDATQSVRVQTDENLQQYLDVSVNGNTLNIHTKSGYNLDPSKEIVVYVSAPQLKDLSVTGASKLLGEGTFTSKDLRLNATGASEIDMNLEVSKLKTELSGASTLRLKGKAESVSTEASGASKIQCADLTTDETRLDLSGASNARVVANKKLVIEASGASDVEYSGNADVNQKSSGASSVKKI